MIRSKIICYAMLVAVLLVNIPKLHASTSSVPCGGDFDEFMSDVVSEAVETGRDRSMATEFFSHAKLDPKVIERDQSQGIFRKSFIEFSKLVMTQYRIIKGREFAEAHAEQFDKVAREFGVPSGVLLSFLALETDYGVVQGNFNTLDALATLAHDCRRPELFRPHLIAAAALAERGDFDPITMQGAWAGEIGMIQMLPQDILLHGRDGDGDGRVDLRTSTADALTTAATVLRELGWQPNSPWLTEIVLPTDFDWSLTGLDQTRTLAEWRKDGIFLRSGSWPDSELLASVLLPQGRHGPAFFAFPNFRIYFEWNRSFVYATTSAFFANLLSGAPLYRDGDPEPPLSTDDVIELQQELAALGHDVGPIDGIVGSKTRAAVQAEQIRMGLPADAWPNTTLLNLLQ